MQFRPVEGLCHAAPHTEVQHRHAVLIVKEVHLQNSHATAYPSDSMISCALRQAACQPSTPQGHVLAHVCLTFKDTCVGAGWPLSSAGQPLG